MFVNELGRFVAETRFEDLPPSVVEAAKMRILDLITAAMVGFRIGVHRPLFEILGHEEVTVFGEGVKYPLRDAVLINSFIAHSIYFEDGSRLLGASSRSSSLPLFPGRNERIKWKGGHPCCCPRLRCVHSPGKSNLSVNGRKRVPSTAVLGALGSAAACASLLEFNRERCKNALAIACNLGVGLKAALKTPHSQPIQVGRSCEGGLLSALFADRGAPGSDTIIEDGFLKAFADRPNKEEILSGLGRGIY
jgi:2-methylcitrate dehydratase PrpD